MRFDQPNTIHDVSTIGTPAPSSTLVTESLEDLFRDRTVLDLAEARRELQALGLCVSKDQMARWASSRVFPFFLMGKKLMIQRCELHKALQQRQLAAVRGEGPSRARRRRVRSSVVELGFFH
jgi:hypothetical protein